MKKKHLGVAIALGSTLLLGACGGGGGSSSSVSLTGTWKGVLNDASGVSGFGDTTNFYEMDVTVSGTSITDISVGGTSTGDTGVITKYSGNIYTFTMAQGGAGGFLTDSAANHAGILDINGPAFSAVQKGATALVTNYAAGDVVYSWSGYSVHLAGGVGNPDVTGNSSATVAADGSFSGTGPAGNFTGQLYLYYPTTGLYTGTYSNSTAGTSGNVWIYLSPDKKFAASWACDGPLETNQLPAAPIVTPPSDACSYNSWNRQ